MTSASGWLHNNYITIKQLALSLIKHLVNDIVRAYGNLPDFNARMDTHKLIDYLYETYLPRFQSDLTTDQIRYE